MNTKYIFIILIFFSINTVIPSNEQKNITFCSIFKPTFETCINIGINTFFFVGKDLMYNDINGFPHGDTASNIIMLAGNAYLVSIVMKVRQYYKNKKNPQDLKNKLENNVITEEQGKDKIKTIGKLKSEKYNSKSQSEIEIIKSESYKSNNEEFNQEDDLLSKLIHGKSGRSSTEDYPPNN